MRIFKLLAAVSAFSVAGLCAASAAEAPKSPADGLKAAAAQLERAGQPDGAANQTATIKLAQRRFKGRRGGHHHHRRHRRGRNIGTGVAVGAAALLILGLAADANASDYRRRCRRLWNRCDDGEGWACRKARRAGC